MIVSYIILYNIYQWYIDESKKVISFEKSHIRQFITSSGKVP